MTEWKIAQLKSVCSDIVDCPHSTPVWTTYGKIVLRSQNIRNGKLDLTSKSFTDEKHFQDRIKRIRPIPGDLVITREAPMGEVCIPEHLECCLGQRMVLLRPNQDIIDNRFLLYSIQSPFVQHEIKVNEGTGSTVSNLRIPVLESLPIPLPPLPVQRRIADILGALDDKIELNRRMNATLEAMARALFKSWFVDFDPVHAKAAGQPTGLPAHIDALFPSAFVDSPLGQIPQGWGVQAVNQIININPSTSLRAGTLAPFVSMNMLPTSGYSITDRVYDKYVGGTKFINGDVLLARITPSLENGKTAIIDFLNDGQVGFGSTEFIIMREKDAIKTPFIACLARLESFRDHCIQSMTGSTGRQRVDNSCFDNFLMAIPNSNEVLHQFSLQTSTYFRQISHNTEQIRTLTALRDTLLPKLLSGEVEV
jgi:type I restriction enzyme S subunit